MTTSFPRSPVPSGCAEDCHKIQNPNKKRGCSSFFPDCGAAASRKKWQRHFLQLAHGRFFSSVPAQNSFTITEQHRTGWNAHGKTFSGILHPKTAPPAWSMRRPITRLYVPSAAATSFPLPERPVFRPTDAVIANPSLLSFPSSR